MKILYNQLNINIILLNYIEINQVINEIENQYHKDYTHQINYKRIIIIRSNHYLIL